MFDLGLRGWDTKAKKMFDVISVDFTPSSHNIVESMDYLMEHTSGMNLDCTLMPYLGFSDKNDKPVYAGDIIVVYLTGNPEIPGEKALFVVEIDQNEWGYSQRWTHLSGCACSTHIVEFDPKNFEIIGNIFENPEMDTRRSETE